MPRYYFDIRDDDGFHRDEVGVDLANAGEAREQCQGVLDIAREEMPDGELHTVTCDVRDETGRVVYRGSLTYEGTWEPT